MALHTPPVDLFDRGYTELVSIIPPGATISEASAIDPSQAGKAPGRKNSKGTWGGYDWRSCEVKRGHAVSWGMAKSNVGLRAAFYPGVDIDTVEPTLADLIERRAVEILGPAPCRVGRAPKRLLVYRTSQPFGRMRLWLTDGDGTAHLVEILGDGQQYVVAGTHPATGKAYEWTRPLPFKPAGLTEIEADKARAFLDALAEDAEFLGYRVEREGTGRDQVDRGAIDQEGLRAPSLDHVRRVADLIPNTNEAFPGRDDYLRVGYAIKAAGGEEAFEVYADWAAKWEGNDRAVDNDPETVAADWARMVPPFQVGWGYLLDKATELNGGTFNGAVEEFEAQEGLEAPPEYQGSTPGEKTHPGPIQGPSGPSSAKSAPAGAFLSTVKYSDTAAGTRLIKHERYAGRLRYCSALGGWLAWKDGRWVMDETRQVAWWATKVANDYAAEAASDGTLTDRDAKAIASRLCTAGAKEALLSCAQIMPGVPAAHSDFDADPMVINTPAGLIDLATGALAGGDLRPLVTKRTAVAPAAGDHPIWSAFLEEATAGDKALQRYLQILSGYCLTGLTREQILVFLWGPGGNGKSVFLSTLAGVMGDYAVGSQAEVFAAGKNDRHPTEVARMRGARLVSAPETQEGRAMDEAKVKQLTGGDKIAARFMNQDFFEFTPQFKLLLVGNHKPTIRNLDVAMRRRLHLVPFTQQPKVVDRMLTEKLKGEWPQILRWALEGCAAWLEEGLVPPAVVVAQTAEYFEDEDPLGAFLEEKCVVKENLTCRSQDIFTAWATWAHERNEPVGTQKGFVQRITGKPGITRWREPMTGLRGLRGVELIYQEGEFEAQPAPERARA